MTRQERKVGVKPSPFLIARELSDAVRMLDLLVV